MKIPEIIETEYNYWIDFMNHKVEFGLKSGVHTKAHCSRVLLFALVIAAQKGLGEREKSILGAAAVYHDSRRFDDSLDVGHGLRAANYYKSSCGENGLAYEQACYDIKDISVYRNLFNCVIMPNRLLKPFKEGTNGRQK